METEEKQIDIYDLLDSIEQKPAIYLGEKSLSLLRAFIDGYLFAARRSLLRPNGFFDFHEWVALRLGYFESTSGYVNMILKSEMGDETKGFDRFFQLWHDFRNRKSRTIYEAIRCTMAIAVSQRRLDTGEVEEMDSNLIQVVKYTDDNAGFLKYVTSDGVINEKYVKDLDRVFWLADAYGFEIDESAWQKVGD